MLIFLTWLPPSSGHHDRDLGAGAVGAQGVKERPGGQVGLAGLSDQSGTAGLGTSGATGATGAEGAGVLVDLRHGLGQRGPDWREQEYEYCE